MGVFCRTTKHINWLIPGIWPIDAELHEWKPMPKARRGKKQAAPEYQGHGQNSNHSAGHYRHSRRNSVDEYQYPTVEQQRLHDQFV